MDKIFYTEEDPIRFPGRPDYTSESEQPGNVIKYKAACKLPEVENGDASGIYIESGNHIVSHEFNNGVGTIIFQQNIFSLNAKEFAYSVITEIDLPNTITQIGESCFNDCKLLKKVNIPNNTITINPYAFYNCINLVKITIPKNVRIIGTYAFNNCYSLKEVVIENGVQSIGSQAFANCPLLQRINIPNSVTDISSTLGGDYNLEYLDIDTEQIGSNLTATLSVRHVNIGENVKYINSNAFASCNYLEEIIIPNNVINISGGCFNGLVSLKKAIIHAQTIGGGSFCGCWSLQEVETSSETIGNGCFNGNNVLKSIKFCDGVVSIGESVGAGCPFLQELIIPKTVTLIGGNIFASSISLTHIEVDKDNTVYDSRNNCNALIITDGNGIIKGCNDTIIPDDIVYIGPNSFASCLTLQNISIPNEQNSIFINTFCDCRSLMSIKIPDGIKTIEQNAFLSCRSLKEITIPQSVTTIGKTAFKDCVSLKKITSLRTQQPNIDSTTFQNIATYGKLYIPQGANYNTWMSQNNYYLGKYSWTTATIPLTD